MTDIKGKINDFLDKVAKNYIGEMHKAGVYGGDIELGMICKLLQVNVVVHNANTKEKKEIFYSKNSTDILTPTIHLQYTGNHYNVADSTGNIVTSIAGDGNCLFNACITAYNKLVPAPTNKEDIASKNIHDHVALRKEVCALLQQKIFNKTEIEKEVQQRFEDWEPGNIAECLRRSDGTKIIVICVHDSDGHTNYIPNNGAHDKPPRTVVHLHYDKKARHYDPCDDKGNVITSVMATDPGDNCLFIAVHEYLEKERAAISNTDGLDFSSDSIKKTVTDFRQKSSYSQVVADFIGAAQKDIEVNNPIRSRYEMFIKYPDAAEDVGFLPECDLTSEARKLREEYKKYFAQLSSSAPSSTVKLASSSPSPSPTEISEAVKTKSIPELSLDVQSKEIAAIAKTERDKLANADRWFAFDSTNGLVVSAIGKKEGVIENIGDKENSTFTYNSSSITFVNQTSSVPKLTATGNAYELVVEAILAIKPEKINFNPPENNELAKQYIDQFIEAGVKKIIIVSDRANTLEEYIHMKMEERKSILERDVTDTVSKEHLLDLKEVAREEVEKIKSKVTDENTSTTLTPALKLASVAKEETSSVVVEPRPTI